MRLVGIDLAGSEKRPTGFCIMDSKLSTRTMILHTTKEILSQTVSVHPDIVSIDAPLSLPKGRKSLAAKYRNGPHFRACDLELRRMKIRFFPVTLGPMRTLTRRGIRLRKILEAHGVRVIEGYPGGVQDVLGMPRKNEGLEKLREALILYGCSGDVAKPGVTHHELDAVTCSLVGKMVLDGNYLAIGDPHEGLLYLPKPMVDQTISS